MGMDEIESAVMLVLMFIVFGIPALAIAARLALRPIVDAIARLREIAAPPALPRETVARLAALEAELSSITTEVRRLSALQAFDRQLTGKTLPEGSRGEEPR